MYKVLATQTRPYSYAKDVISDCINHQEKYESFMASCIKGLEDFRSMILSLLNKQQLNFKSNDLKSAHPIQQFFIGRGKQPGTIITNLKESSNESFTSLLILLKPTYITECFDFDEHTKNDSLKQIQDYIQTFRTDLTHYFNKLIKNSPSITKEIIGNSKVNEKNIKHAPLVRFLNQYQYFAFNKISSEEVLNMLTKSDDPLKALDDFKEKATAFFNRDYTLFYAKQQISLYLELYERRIKSIQEKIISEKIESIAKEVEAFELEYTKPECCIPQTNLTEDFSKSEEKESSINLQLKKIDAILSSLPEYKRTQDSVTLLKKRMQDASITL